MKTNRMKRRIKKEKKETKLLKKDFRRKKNKMAGLRTRQKRKIHNERITKDKKKERKLKVNKV